MDLSRLKVTALDINNISIDKNNIKYPRDSNSEFNKFEHVLPLN
jgi:hypothetical protein